MKKTAVYEEYKVLKALSWLKSLQKWKTTEGFSYNTNELISLSLLNDEDATGKHEDEEHKY